ncbi:peroxiredoxin [Thiogranum longum]|uniref:Peroxiredoxin n=1 Tax=Thiogranum longum TaxID=1537524 RepID=A0A4V6NDC4_9GAMM|nr:protein disulfide oxidoreductase [Thiogranum longum]TCK19186.1 peroxiredoxin [Thiogranum longum]
MKNPEPASDSKISRKRHWLRYAFEALLFVLALTAIQMYQTREVVEGPAPAFEGVLLDGKAVSLESVHERPLLLHFWASWCPVCNLEQGSIQRISEDYPVLTVSIDDMPADKLLEWMAAKGVSYPVVTDPSGAISRRYGIKGVPASLVIDKDNQIRFSGVGYTTETGLRLRLWWAGQ